MKPCSRRKSRCSGVMAVPRVNRVVSGRSRGMRRRRGSIAGRSWPDDGAEYAANGSMVPTWGAALWFPDGASPDRPPGGRRARPPRRVPGARRRLARRSRLQPGLSRGRRRPRRRQGGPRPLPVHQRPQPRGVPQPAHAAERGRGDGGGAAARRPGGRRLRDHRRHGEPAARGASGARARPGARRDRARDGAAGERARRVREGRRVLRRPLRARSRRRRLPRRRRGDGAGDHARTPCCSWRRRHRTRRA